MNILGIGLDYLMLKGDKIRGDVRARQYVYAEALDSLNLVVYAPKSEGFKKQEWAKNLVMHPTNSISKAFFIRDAYRTASEIIKSQKIDAITCEDPFTCGVVGYLLKRKFGIKLNVQVHIDFFDNKYWMSLRPVNRLFNMVGKFIIKRADTIRCGTGVEKETLAASGVKRDRINVIPVNSEIKKFQGGDGTTIRKKYLGSSYDHLVLFTGRLVKQKDLPMLLKVVPQVVAKSPKTLFLIVGTGDQEDMLKRKAEAMGLRNNLQFSGSVSIDIIPDYLRACDVYVVPSIYEGTCIAMAEAMSAAKPIVVTKFAGAQDLVEDYKTGLLVDIQDDQTFAQKILYIFDHPDEAKQMGERAKNRIEEVFKDNRNIGRVIDMWKKTART